MRQKKRVDGSEEDEGKHTHTHTHTHSVCACVRVCVPAEVTEIMTLCSRSESAMQMMSGSNSGTHTDSHTRH